MRKISKQLFCHNFLVNRFKAILYCYGLSTSRYIEYSIALSFLLVEIKRKSSVVLDVGCGHSVFPTFLQKLGLNVIVVDSNNEALKWQMKKSLELNGSSVKTVLADMQCLPFKDQSIPNLSCISAIEHIPKNGDIEAASEAGRVLMDKGTFVVSFPLSSQKQSRCITNPTSGVPTSLRRVFKVALPTIFKKFNVDRGSTYFERLFSSKDVYKRVVSPSHCQEECNLTLRSSKTVKFIHQRLFPTGTLTLLEYFLVNFMEIGENLEGDDAAILKLKKR